MGECVVCVHSLCIQVIGELEFPPYCSSLPGTAGAGAGAECSFSLVDSIRRLFIDDVAMTILYQLQRQSIGDGWMDRRTDRLGGLLYRPPSFVVVKKVASSFLRGLSAAARKSKCRRDASQMHVRFPWPHQPNTTARPSNEKSTHKPRERRRRKSFSSKPLFDSFYSMIPFK